jgi:hypothetical protein
LSGNFTSKSDIQDAMVEWCENKAIKKKKNPGNHDSMAS